MQNLNVTVILLQQQEYQNRKESVVPFRKWLFTLVHLRNNPWSYNKKIGVLHEVEQVDRRAKEDT